MWTDPSGHVYVTGEVVTAATMNNLIRLNLQSSRFWQRNSGQKIIDAGSTFTSTTANQQVGATHYNLFDAVPDDNYKMIVVASVVLNTTITGGHGANYAAVTCYDQGGTAIGLVYGTVLANDDTPMALVAGASYSSGAQNGFVLKASPLNATDMAIGYEAAVFFTPQT